MPNILTGVQGYTSLTQRVALALETGGVGESVLLAQTATASTLSLTTQPNTISATTGMHLHVMIIGNTTAGSIVISGTNPAGGSVTSITYHVPVAPQNNAGFSEFCTKEAWATVNASGIACTTLTNAQIIIWGNFAGKYLIPMSMDKEEKIAKFSPMDKRGILFKNFRVVQLTKGVDVSKFDAALYPDSLWAYYMMFGATSTTPTTVPSSPTSLLASTSIASPMTLTTQPTTPGMFLIFSITGNTASGTIVVGGTDQFGLAYSTNETITFTSAATQTVYSTRRYSVVNTSALGVGKFSTTGGTSSSIAVTGVYCWLFTWTWDGINNLTPYTACLEGFDGVEGFMIPGFSLDSLDFAWSKDKDIALSSKGMGQDLCIVGDPTSTTGGTNPFATIAQPVSQPVVSWPASFYIDAGSGSALTTQDGTFLDFKFGWTTGRKWMHSGDGQQRPAFVTWDSEPDFSADATIVLTNYANYVNYFKPNAPMILSTTFTGTWLANNAGTNVYESVSIIMPVRVDTEKLDQAANPVKGVIKFISCYDFTNLGYGARIQIQSATPPTYLA